MKKLTPNCLVCIFSFTPGAAPYEKICVATVGFATMRAWANSDMASRSHLSYEREKGKKSRPRSNFVSKVGRLFRGKNVCARAWKYISLGTKMSEAAN